ncbi:C40 family peptidase [Piscinibacter gummiphilus]|uniref:C40 family peptidase n=1 Tax=Piscinibacter gummiphilus TaxID=946333 RepID=A0ABZ0CMU6_9BURK|nr:C40 family peptidase [Piscinibacter gummiphilus]WOB06316.1 C40 family peptidase [Piscinibacter gummiphilus]
MSRLPLPCLRSALLALACAGAAAAAQAAPDNQDVVAQLLIERGVLSAPHTSGTTAVDSAAAIGRQVRDTTSGLVLSAMNFLGVPYKRGGNNSDDGFDCSGFTRHIYETTLGLVLPRRVDDQAKAAGFSAVKRDELQPGDLVFFNTLRRTFSHVGIYVGEGKFIHAPRSGGEVRVESMGVKYWAKRFTGARRADTAATLTATPPAPSAQPAAGAAPAIPNEFP